MKGRLRKVDKVRASRDGHERHEVWVARKAMQLLWPDCELSAIAIEGLSPADQSSASDEIIEIADAVLYFGGIQFDGAAKTTIVQFKYSVSSSEKTFRATDAKKTVEKFATAYQEFRARYGAVAVRERLDFELVTNRPIFTELVEAIRLVAKGGAGKGTVAKQMEQFEKASGLRGGALREFAEKFALVGRCGDLPSSKRELSGLIVDWSVSSDTVAAARLGRLCSLIRGKAGTEGEGANLIRQTDILAVFDRSDVQELLPCPAALVDVGEIVEREQFEEAVNRLASLTYPLLIHAPGGAGKTVFLESLAAALSKDSEVVFFDCFGGGAYRSVEDSRHLPRNGITHIINSLAFRGLCDPILPDQTATDILLRTFRRRMEQCVETVKRITPDRDIALFIDAIDNAQIVADLRSEDAFPTLLLQSLQREPIQGVRLIVSSRSERKPSVTVGELELRLFTQAETRAYLKARVPSVSLAQVQIAQARSRGNPRVLEYLVESERILEPSGTQEEIELDDLLQARIERALHDAVERGHRQEDIDSFIAGLSVLPPPVPAREYAQAHGLHESAVESFAADLYPLLERTNQGLMFRDEPTETYVRNRYAARPEQLSPVADNLLENQESSVYAARALPGLLHALGDHERLFSLAFDERIPAEVTSTVGQRNIRYARLKMAALDSAIRRDHDRLVQVLLGLSTVAAVDQRGTQYLQECPDLVVAAGDPDSLRRLFETRTAWAGARHSRLTIANSLSGDSDEAYRHAVITNDWLEHFYRTEDGSHRDARPDRIDGVALTFFLLSQGRTEDAIRMMGRWRNFYAFELCELLFQLSHLAERIGVQEKRALAAFVYGSGQLGVLAAALSHLRYSKSKRSELCSKLSKICKKASDLGLRDSITHSSDSYVLQDGLRKSAAIALSLGLRDEALSISLRAPHKRPGYWTFTRDYNNRDAFPFLFRCALVAATTKKRLHEKDLVPKELHPVCKAIPRSVCGTDFVERAAKRLRAWPRWEKHGDDPAALSDDAKRECQEFLSRRLPRLLLFTNSLSGFLSAPAGKASSAFRKLLATWKEVSRPSEHYYRERDERPFYMIGREALTFAVWARDDLSEASVRSFTDILLDRGEGPYRLIEIVSVLSGRRSTQELALELAAPARAGIEKDDDVTSRASLFMDLSRAVLPASRDDASHFFRAGLEQMDAIGSGDYEFTNELLLFASQLQGGELSSEDIHVLSNICELNVGEESDKFPWGAFARGMVRASGLRGLAKLSRWDDRRKVPLDYTLLQYLSICLEARKISPETAVSLNWLADPAEYWEFGTKEFTDAVCGVAGKRPDLTSEIVNQYLGDNSGVPSDSTVAHLATLVEETLGKANDLTAYLKKGAEHFGTVRAARDEQRDFSSPSDARLGERAAARDRQNAAAIREIVRNCNPVVAEQLAAAVAAFDALEHSWDLRDGFLAMLRSKVGVADRAQYVRNVFALENLGIYLKLAELKVIKEEWSPSFASLGDLYRSEMPALLTHHADDFVDYGRLSGYKVKEMSDLSGIEIGSLAIDLVRTFARPDTSLPGAVWLALASFVCPLANPGKGQLALTRLLRSDAAMLTDSVQDGPYRPDSYPGNDETEVAASLVWRVLGSPVTSKRWRAAHSVRSLARMSKWDVIERLVGKLAERRAGPFQALDLPFFYLHARVWLLIALARLALDHPREVSRFKDQLLAIVLDPENTHVLTRHFAARALLACIDKGEVKVDSATERNIRKIDKSPHPPDVVKHDRGGGFYQGRPDSAPEPAFDFNADYDFRKHEIDNLSRVFGKPIWVVDDMIAEVVHSMDASVISMFDEGGRETPRHRSGGYGLSDRVHRYGQQLAWHATLIVAGALLRDCPVVHQLWDSARWEEWLRDYLLTREDGLWLADGIDFAPIDSACILQGKAKNGIALKGGPEVLAELLGFKDRISRDLVVEGDWRSVDGVKISIGSALVRSQDAARIARSLNRTNPFLVCVPTFSYEDPDDVFCEEPALTPWITCPGRSVRLDEHDPFGSRCANWRPRFGPQLCADFGLTSEDPFGRFWQGPRGGLVARGEAWGRYDAWQEEGDREGYRLLASPSLLRRVLSETGKDLFLVAILQRYEKGSYPRTHDGQYFHSLGFFRIDKDLNVEPFKGKVNRLHKMRH